MLIDGQIKWMKEKARRMTLTVLVYGFPLKAYLWVQEVYFRDDPRKSEYRKGQSGLGKEKATSRKEESQSSVHY